MLELVDMSGISAQFRICKMRTANSNKVGGTLNGNFRAPKFRVPEITFGGVFCMRGGALRKKDTPRVVWTEKSKNGLRFEIGPTYL